MVQTIDKRTIMGIRAVRFFHTLYTLSVLSAYSLSTLSVLYTLHSVLHFLCIYLPILCIPNHSSFTR